MYYIPPTSPGVRIDPLTCHVFAGVGFVFNLEITASDSLGELRLHEKKKHPLVTYISRTCPKDTLVKHQTFLFGSLASRCWGMKQQSIE